MLVLDGTLFPTLLYFGPIEDNVKFKCGGIVKVYYACYCWMFRVLFHFGFLFGLMHIVAYSCFSNLPLKFESVDAFGCILSIFILLEDE